MSGIGVKIKEIEEIKEFTGVKIAKLVKIAKQLVQHPFLLLALGDRNACLQGLCT